ncbi:MAG: hypothetical protein ACE5Q6_18645 [Dehalococcoidia bacterium]
MITVSDRAKAVLSESLHQSGVPADRGFRLQPGADGFSLELDKPTRDDRVIRHMDVPVLIIDGVLDEKVDDLMSDVTDGEQGAQLTIRSTPPS